MPHVIKGLPNIRAYTNPSSVKQYLTPYLRQLSDEAAGIGPGGSLLDLVLGHVLPAVPDVLGYGHSEQHGLLQHHSDLTAQPRDVQVLNGIPVNLNLANKINLKTVQD